MRAEIDLTPDRDFSEFYKNNGLYKKTYKHKSIPWRDKKDPPGWIYMNDNIIEYTGFDNRLIAELSEDQDLESFTVFGDMNFNNTSWSMNTFSSYSNSSTQKYSYLFYNKKSSSVEVETSEIMDFPTGNRKEIISKRKYKTRKIAMVKRSCKYCKKMFVEKPWRNSSETSFCSDKCEELYKNSLRYTKAKKTPKLELWRQYDENPANNSLRYFTMKRCNALCISSEYQDEESSHKYYKELPWSYFDTYEGKNMRHTWPLYVQAKSLSYNVLIKALYYKGKHVPINGEKLQPKGRVPQEYDDIFDKLDWRELLLKRLDDEEKIKKEQAIKENKAVKITTHGITISHTTGWDIETALMAI